MVTERITKETLDEFEQFIRTHEKGHFMQSHLWGQVKSEWKWEALAVRDGDGRIKGAMAVLIRKVPGFPFTLMYAGRGPVCCPHDRETIAALVEGARALAKEHRAYTLKIDPDVPSSDTEFAAILKELGFRSKEGGKNFEAIQPRYVFRLNVSGKTEEELMASFHQKTRYNIRLAARKGVVVRIADKSALPDFARIMKDTGLRDGFVTRPESYFARMMDCLGKDARLYMAYLGDTPIAGTLAIHFGDKVWYLYGASANEYRNTMPNYQLQWEMIRWAVETGSRIYDFRGVSGDLSEDNPLYGLYKFKKGFNGDFVEFVGEFDLVLKPAAYFAVEKGSHLYRNLRRRLYLARGRGKADASPEKPAPSSSAEDAAVSAPEKSTDR